MAAIGGYNKALVVSAFLYGNPITILLCIKEVKIMFSIKDGRTAFNQWEQGQILVNEHMKAGDRVFFRGASGETYTMYATSDGVEVPNILLQTARSMIVDLEGRNSCRTAIGVNAAEKPADYVLEDNLKPHANTETVKVYGLHETITTTGAENNITRRYTESFDGIQFDINVTAGESSVGASVEIYTVNGLVSYMWIPAMIDTVAKYTRIQAYKHHGEWVFESMNPVNNQTQTTNLLKNVNYVSAEDAITKVVIYTSGGTMFPANTVINVRTY